VSVAQPVLCNPTRFVVAAARPKPPLEPDGGDLVVPAQAVEQVDELGRIPQEQVAVSGGVFPIHRTVASSQRTGLSSRMSSSSEWASEGMSATRETTTVFTPTLRGPDPPRSAG
jgi:hypothetical protein